MLNNLKFVSLCIIFMNITFSYGQNSENHINIKPISPATFNLEYENLVICVDTIGGKDVFKNQ